MGPQLLLARLWLLRRKQLWLLQLLLGRQCQRMPQVGLGSMVFEGCVLCCGAFCCVE